MAKTNSALKVDLKPLDELLNPSNDIYDRLSVFNPITTPKENGIDVPISEIDNFPDHPFKVVNDEAMQDLVASIKENGLIMPPIVRKKENGRFELISGHRRKMACELAGLEKIPVIVRQMDRDTAVIAMVDSNMQREQIYPSEKAFAYKMRLEAMKRQGQRTDLTSLPSGEKLENKYSVQILSEKVGESTNQIHRYVRLTNLQPEILQMVDEKRLGFQPAVEMSYLNEQEQADLLETMESEDRTPSLSQALRMKGLSLQNRLNIDVIFSIMTEEKPNEKEKITIPRKSIEAYIPKNLTRDKESEFVIKALEYYGKYLTRKKEQEMER